jgi:hypothetical protein
MLSEALQRNAKHEARLSNISDCYVGSASTTQPEILRFAQNDNACCVLTVQRFKRFENSYLFFELDVFSRSLVKKSGLPA